MKIQLDERFLLPDTHAKQTNILHSFPKIYTSLTQNNRNGWVSFKCQKYLTLANYSISYQRIIKDWKQNPKYKPSDKKTVKN